METETREKQVKVTKQLVPYTDPKGTIRLMWQGGGELPNTLSGTYTTIREAIKAVDSYLANIKGTSNAKSKDRETV